MTQLKTQRLILTPMSADDMDDLIQLWSDDAFTRFITGRALSEEEVWLRCLRDIGHWQVLNHGNWVIRETETKQFVGTVGIFDYRRDIKPVFDSPEVGWGLATRFHGQGLATEALKAALNWADSRITAPRTVCMISPDNLASVQLAQRLGFQSWSTTRYKDSEVVLYERLKCSRD